MYNDSGLVIQTSAGTPLGLRNRILDAIVKEHPAFPKIRFHDLRHTHATLLLKAGIQPTIVQERLGHSSINITLDTLQESVIKHWRFDHRHTNSHQRKH